MRIKLMTAPCLPAGGFRMYELSLDAARLRSSRRPAAVGAGLGPDADRGMDRRGGRTPDAPSSTRCRWCRYQRRESQPQTAFFSPYL